MLEKYSFGLTGKTPLLMHQDNVEASDELDAWRKDPANKGRSKAGDDRSPPWTWTTYLFHDGEHVAFPADAVMAALRAAGSDVILKKQTTFKRLTQSNLMVTDLLLTFRSGGKPIPVGPISELGPDATFQEHVALAKKLGFSLFVKRLPVGGSKHVRVRPRFDDWTVEGTIVVTAPEFTKERLKQIFDIACEYKGFLDGRPNSPKCPCVFGRASVELKKVR